MQEVQTLSRLGEPLTMACTVWIFGFQRRRVRRCENETFLPKPGPLPHTSQTEATVRSIDRVTGLVGCRHVRLRADQATAVAYPIPRRPREPAQCANRRNVGRCFYAAR